MECSHVHLQYCSGTFLQRATLEKHMENFHVELQCGNCGSTFVGAERDGQKPNRCNFCQVWTRKDWTT